jgi:hypothetical protein
MMVSYGCALKQFFRSIQERFSAIGGGCTSRIAGHQPSMAVLTDHLLAEVLDMNVKVPSASRAFLCKEKIFSHISNPPLAGRKSLSTVVFYTIEAAFSRTSPFLYVNSWSSIDFSNIGITLPA